MGLQLYGICVDLEVICSIEMPTSLCGERFYSTLINQSDL